MLGELITAEIAKYDDKLKKAVDFLESEFKGIRAGRANPNMLDKIVVDYYGTPTPIKQMANIIVTDARTLTVAVWDISALKNVVKAIRDSDMGINPVDDGKVVRLVFPQLTEERRKEITKTVHKRGEDCKVTLRNERRDTLDKIKKMKKEADLSEDEVSEAEALVQKKLDAEIVVVDKMVKAKDAEILEV